jgi:hypothetical protein
MDDREGWTQWLAASLLLAGCGSSTAPPGNTVDGSSQTTGDAAGIGSRDASGRGVGDAHPRRSAPDAAAPLRDAGHPVTDAGRPTADAGAPSADGGGQSREGGVDSGMSTAIPLHTETWAYDDGCNGGTGASTALVRQWVTYAESNCGPMATKVLTDCHEGGTTYCTALAYIDANLEWQNGGMLYGPLETAASETWWLHQAGYTDSAHRLVWNGRSYGTGYALDQLVTAVDTWVQGFARTNFDSFDGFMMDDTAASLAAQFYASDDPAYTTSEEITTNAQLQASHEQMASAMSHTDGSPFFLVQNGIGPNPYLATPWPMMNHPANVHGFVSEGNPWSGGTLSSFYSSLLDDLAEMSTYPSGNFIALLSYDSSGSLQGRRVHEATVLLGYAPTHVVSWGDLEQSSGDLAVWPEVGIYPTEAVQTMGAPSGSGCLGDTGVVCSVGGHNDVRVASGTNVDDGAAGVFGREFATCYNQGVPFGACAVIVNDTSSAVTVESAWLTHSYGHEITMVGGDIQSGGTIDLTGAPFAPGSTTIAANDALLLAP